MEYTEKHVKHDLKQNLETEGNKQGNRGVVYKETGGYNRTS